MKKNLLIFWICSALVILFAVYRRWFSLSPLSAGDWSFHFPEEVAHFFILPSFWKVSFHGGLGGNGVFLAGLEAYFLATARLFNTITGLSWSWSERIIWYVPFLLVGTYTSVFLVRAVFPKITSWWLTPIIFLTNTYILMITGGGQMGIAMAYALAPLVLAQFIKLFNHPTVRRGIITGLILSLMILFDSRIAYVLMIGVLLWGLVFRPKPVFIFALPFILAGLIHAFWVLPLVVFRVNPIESLGSAYNSIAAVRFFSFSDFSHSLSLLHPNWPENLFGKVYFLRPEFLIIPILALSAFLNKKTSLSIISMGMLALLGVFLAKGANPPGGGIYLWLFAHVPGFNVFRDPTKFYLLTAIAYSILIPVALDRIAKKKVLLGMIFILFWLFTIRQSVAGQLGGTFASHTVPHEYEILKDVINQPEYFRTFWVPRVQRYGFSTYTHPAIDAGSVLDTSTPSTMLAWLDSEEGKHQLTRWSVKYVVLPYDSQGEIFLDDGKYSEKERNVFQEALDANPNFNKKIIPDIPPTMSVYETIRYNDHLWLEGGSSGAIVSWRMMSPTAYAVEISGLDSPTPLIFSESYDPYWQLDIDGRTIRSEQTIDSLNSFSLPALNNASGTLEYLPQRYVWIGLFISVVAIIGAVIALAVLQ